MSPQSIHSGNLNTTSQGNQPGNSTNNRRMSLASLKSFTLMLPAVPETEDSETTKADSTTGLNLEIIFSSQSLDVVVNMEDPVEQTANENGAEVLPGEQKSNDVQIEDDTTQQFPEAAGSSKMAASMPVIDDHDSKPRKSFNNSTNKSKSLNFLDALPGTNAINTSKKKHWNSWSSFMSIFNKRLPIITHSSHNLSYSTTTTLEPNNDTTKPLTDDQK